VMYWGLGQGFALDRKAGKAWTGRPEAGSWTWKPQPDALTAITELMAIHEDKSDPAFVSLPAQLDGETGAAAK
jgi:hypothetical protein